MRELSLHEVLAGAERAAERVSRWPAWKRALGKTLAEGRARMPSVTPEKTHAQADRALRGETRRSCLTPWRHL